MTQHKRHCNNCHKDFFCYGQCKVRGIIKNPVSCYCLKCATEKEKLKVLKNSFYNVLAFGCQKSNKEKVEFT